ncbi:MAG: SHOCT domain-containing protein [Burkholderiales bacterium]|nr:SHOCT domain-containing protein [Burkholderiales bacterium]
MWGHMGGYGGGWGFGPLSMALFWILIIAGIVVLGKWIFDRSGGAPRGKSALDILEERYARGEIGKEEFEQKKRDIEG